MLNPNESKEEESFDLNAEPRTIAEGIKWVAEMNNYRSDLEMDIKSGCDEQCQHQVKPCVLLKGLQKPHATTSGESGKQFGLDTGFNRDASPTSMAEGIAWLKKMRDFKWLCWYNIKLECEKRCNEGVKP